MRDVPAYSSPSVNSLLVPTTIPRRGVGPHDVDIDIRYAGICHTDLVQTRDGWGSGIYPMVPGHEIAGVVTEVGGEVTRFAPGDRVGATSTPAESASSSSRAWRSTTPPVTPPPSQLSRTPST